MRGHALHKPLTPGRVVTLCAAMALLLLLVICTALLLGTAEISADQLLALLSGEAESTPYARLILFEIRLPRIILAALVGAALAVGGVVFQALLRNPLADPFILGVSSGSAFGAVLGIVLGFGFALGVPASAFAGALLTIAVLLRISADKMGMESTTILLTGVIINAFFTAIIMFFISVTADAKLHSMLYWLYGDLSQTRLEHLLLIGPVVLLASIALYRFALALNLLTAGEEAALQLGVEVDRIKIKLLLLVSLLIGTVVAFSGLIGFIGLIVPHLTRMLSGADHRLLLPLAALAGASFLVAADTLARILISPSELPVGVISAFLGAPFFIYLLRTRGSHWGRS